MWLPGASIPFTAIYSSLCLCAGNFLRAANTLSTVFLCRHLMNYSSSVLQTLSPEVFLRAYLGEAEHLSRVGLKEVFTLCIYATPLLVPERGKMQQFLPQPRQTLRTAVDLELGWIRARRPVGSVLLPLHSVMLFRMTGGICTSSYWWGRTWVGEQGLSQS